MSGKGLIGIVQPTPWYDDGSQTTGGNFSVGSAQPTSATDVAAEQQGLATDAANAAQSNAGILQSTEEQEANAFGTSFANIQSGAGRSGHGLEADITSPLGLEPDPDEESLMPKLLGR